MKLSRRELPAPRIFEEPFDDGKAFAPAAGILEAMEPFAHSAAARKKLEHLAGGRGRVFVTGQQPCFPLPLGLTLQKAATALALARESEHGVAVFWNGSDDSDFEEAASQFLPRVGRSPLRVALPAHLERKGRRVGDLDPGPAFADLAKLRPLPFEPRSGEDLGRFHARVLAELFAGEGLLILDARSPALAEAGRELWRRYRDRRIEVARSVDAEGDRLESEGLPRPLRRGIGERALFLIKESRRRLPSQEDYPDALARRLEEAESGLSPNVVLRPMLQDSVLPVAGAVLGPSEWLYHHQIRPAFEILDTPFPQPWPRLDAAGPWELERETPPAEGRRHSPLLDVDLRLGEAGRLIDLAQVHLEDWREKNYHRLIPDGEERP